MLAHFRQGALQERQQWDATLPLLRDQTGNRIANIIQIQQAMAAIVMIMVVLNVASLVQVRSGIMKLFLFGHPVLSMLTVVIQQTEC